MLDHEFRHATPPSITGGRRLTWAQVPGQVRSAIEGLLGSEILAATSQPGGFSEGVAARVRLADGRRAFVKAASARDAPAAAGFHRREIEISRRLPAGLPVPRLWDVYDDGTWVALLFEEIDGALPAQPWRRDELDRVLAMIGELAGELTPSPLDKTVLGQPRLGGWLALASASGGALGSASGDVLGSASGDAFGALRSLSPWAADHLDHLVAWEARSGQTLTGETLLHGDLYPFNIMLTPDRAFVIDWPHAWVGPVYCDLLTLLSSAALSGVDPQPLADRHPLTRHLDDDEINIFLAAHSGFLVRLAVTAGPGVDSELLAMMGALGRASLHWLRTRLGGTGSL